MKIMPVKPVPFVFFLNDVFVRRFYFIILAVRTNANDLNIWYIIM
jgi:hypothetical protein